jgi:hypothetical protein
LGINVFNLFSLLVTRQSHSRASRSLLICAAAQRALYRLNGLTLIATNIELLNHEVERCLQLEVLPPALLCPHRWSCAFCLNTAQEECVPHNEAIIHRTREACLSSFALALLNNEEMQIYCIRVPLPFFRGIFSRANGFGCLLRTLTSPPG